jgi:hypothetical protein
LGHGLLRLGRATGAPLDSVGSLFNFSSMLSWSFVVVCRLSFVGCRLVGCSALLLWDNQFLAILSRRETTRSFEMMLSRRVRVHGHVYCIASSSTKTPRLSRVLRYYCLPKLTLPRLRLGRCWLHRIPDTRARVLPASLSIYGNLAPVCLQ